MMAYEVVFKGRVQGVGFRYTARDMARDLGVTGWVKNMPDGSVCLWAEGDEALLDDLINKLEKCFAVRDKKIVRSALMHGFTDFSIEF